jgi:hypothetical protein
MKYPNFNLAIWRLLAHGITRTLRRRDVARRLCLDCWVVAGDAAAADLEQATAEFVAVRGRLFGIAYRMLGSSAEAEDIVQEAWLR